jgi:CzcA family heavy metal efflux pump
MIRWIVGSSMQFRLLVVAAALAMVVFGITQLPNMPVDVLPEFAPPTVEVRTEALGLSADEVEQFITVPMEQDLLNGVAWLADIQSDSVPGLSSIVLTFEPGTDIIRARQMVAERLTQAAVGLPHVSKPPTMLQPLSSTSRVMMIGLSSKTVSLIDMSVLARWTISPRLMGVPGVANVSTWGQRDRELQVLVDPKRLHDKGVSLLQILETTGNAMWVSSLSFVEASTPGTGGFIDTPNQRLGIRHIFPISSPDGLAQVPVEGASSLHLGDVATVVEDHQPLIGDAVTNNSTGLLLVVEKFPGANTLEVTKGLEEALAALQPGLPGIQVDSTIYRPAGFIETALSNVTMLLIIAGILLVLTLGAFLFEWRTALISLIAIPLALLAGGVVLYLRGATANTMVLAGFVIAMGVVVDDAIVDVENIMRRLRAARRAGSDKSTASIILDASVEVRGAIVVATLILMLALVPIFFIGGLSGPFFQSLAFSYALAVLASMVVALIVTPALCLLLLGSAPLERRESPLARRLQQGYERMLKRLLGMPRAALATAALLVVLGLLVVPFLGQSLFPTFKERDLLIHLDGTPSASRPEMDRIVARMSQELRTIPGVRDVGAHVGRAVMSDQVVDVNSSELWVSIDPAANYEATRAAIQNAVRGYPGLRSQVLTYLNETTNGVLTAANDTLTVRVYGDDEKLLRGKADEVKQILTGVDGVAGPHVLLPVEQPQVEVEVDINTAQRYGLKPGDVRRAAATLLSGIQVGSLFEEQKVFDVVVWGTPETRNSLSSIRDLLVDTPSGTQVRLGDVARVNIVAGPNVIKHESVKRYLDVAATVRSGDIGAVASDIERRLQNISFPLEYHAEVLGGYAQHQADWIRLLGLSVAAAIGIYLLLQACFGSWRLATLSFLTLPSALVGGLLAIFAAGGVISLGALVGFFTVFAIAARNGILLIKHCEYLAQYEGEPFGPGLVLRGTRERLVPIVMTALATALVLVPLVVAGNVPGFEIVYPTAVVILGGLITSTVLNLFILPTLYLRYRPSLAPVTETVPLPAGSPATG